MAMFSPINITEVRSYQTGRKKFSDTGHCEPAIWPCTSRASPVMSRLSVISPSCVSIPYLAWGGMKGFSIQGGPALPKCQVTNSPRRMATGKWGWRLNYSVLSSHANWASSQPQEIFQGEKFTLYLSFNIESSFWDLILYSFKYP